MLLLALGVTVGAVLASSTAAAVACALRAEAQRRRRARLRADELALLGAAAQRWWATPAAWGGGGGSFRGATFDAIGTERQPLAPGRRRTENGVYRLVPVPSCATLDLAAERTGLDAGGDGLLVVGWDPATGEDAAAIVLSALVQVPLARVPWAWIAALSAGRRHTAPSRRLARRDATDRAPQPPSRTVLHLVHWPERSGAEPPASAPVRPRRAAGLPRQSPLRGSAILPRGRPP